MLEELNRINIKITALEEKVGNLTVNEIWKLSDLRDLRDDIKMEISVGNLKEELS